VREAEEGAERSDVPTELTNASSDRARLACLKANEFSDHKGIARLNYSSLRAEGYLNEAMVFA
jgi:hypothetical protein